MEFVLFPKNTRQNDYCCFHYLLPSWFWPYLFFITLLQQNYPTSTQFLQFQIENSSLKILSCILFHFYITTKVSYTAFQCEHFKCVLYSKNLTHFVISAGLSLVIPQSPNQNQNWLSSFRFNSKKS